MTSYEILGVNKEDSEETIKSAFRKKLMDNHPDRHPGDPEANNKTKAIIEAYADITKKDQHEINVYMRNQGFTTTGFTITVVSHGVRKNASQGDVDWVYNTLRVTMGQQVVDQIFGSKKPKVGE